MDSSHLVVNSMLSLTFLLVTKCKQTLWIICLTLVTRTLHQKMMVKEISADSQSWGIIGYPMIKLKLNVR